MRVKGSKGKLSRTKKEGFIEMVASMASLLKGAFPKGTYTENWKSVVQITR